MCKHGHHQLFLHQRHMNIERRRNGVDNLLHGVPLTRSSGPDTSSRRSGRERQAHHPRPTDGPRCLW